MIKLILIDDHEIVRQGFKHILTSHDDIEVVYEGCTGKEALEACRKLKADVLLIDLSLPDISGLDVLKQVKSSQEDLKVLILSAYPEEQYGLNVLKAGASGFIGKETVADSLITAIRLVAQGKRFISPKLAEMLAGSLTHDIEQPLHTKLSEREFQIFCKLATGKSIVEIAGELFISVKTVSTYRSRLLEKLNLKTNADLTYYAVKNQLIL